MVTLKLPDEWPSAQELKERLQADPKLAIEIPAKILKEILRILPPLCTVLTLLPFGWAKSLRKWVCLAADFFDDLYIGPADLVVTLDLPTIGTDGSTDERPGIVTLATIEIAVVYRDDEDTEPTA